MNNVFRNELSQILNDEVLSVARNVFLDIVLDALNVISLLCNLDVKIHDLVVILDNIFLKFLFGDFFLVHIL